MSVHCKEASTLLEYRYYFLQGTAQRFAFAKHGAGAGVVSTWEQKNLEARKIPEKPHSTPASSARFVRQPARLPKRWLKKDATANTPNFYTQL